jgi:hypothetical protein
MCIFLIRGNKGKRWRRSTMLERAEYNDAYWYAELGSAAEEELVVLSVTPICKACEHSLMFHQETYAIDYGRVECMMPECGCVA